MIVLYSIDLAAIDFAIALNIVGAFAAVVFVDAAEFSVV